MDKRQPTSLFCGNPSGIHSSLTNFHSPVSKLQTLLPVTTFTFFVYHSYPPPLWGVPPAHLPRGDFPAPLAARTAECHSGYAYMTHSRRIQFFHHTTPFRQRCKRRTPAPTIRNSFPKQCKFSLPIFLAEPPASRTAPFCWGKRCARLTPNRPVFPSLQSQTLTLRDAG